MVKFIHAKSLINRVYSTPQKWLAYSKRMAQFAYTASLNSDKLGRNGSLVENDVETHQ